VFCYAIFATFAPDFGKKCRKKTNNTQLKPLKMKKVLLLTMVAALALGFSSCDKAAENDLVGTTWVATTTEEQSTDIPNPNPGDETETETIVRAATDSESEIPGADGTETEGEGEGEENGNDVPEITVTYTVKFETATTGAGSRQEEGGEAEPFQFVYVYAHPLVTITTESDEPMVFTRDGDKMTAVEDSEFVFTKQ
jgi:hypothetical protein